MKIDYHPNFFDLSESKRKDCFDRLNLIKKYINKGSLLDIGCSGGFYSFGLHSVCKPIMAFDNVKPLIDGCLKIQKEYNTTINFRVGTLIDTFIKDNAPWDNILYMSVHHHIISQVGFDQATKIFSDLSKYCSKLFFDMGQKNEKCKQHEWWRCLPNTNDQKEWLTNYILDNTDFSNVSIIGSSKIHGIDRLFFKLEK